MVEISAAEMSPPVTRISEHRKEQDMLLFESDKGYKKVCIWKDEIPFMYVGQNTMHLSVASGDVKWHIGTICIEVKLHRLKKLPQDTAILKTIPNRQNSGRCVIVYA